MTMTMTMKMTNDHDDDDDNKNNVGQRIVLILFGGDNSFPGPVRAQDQYSTRTQWKDPSSSRASKKFDFAQEPVFLELLSSHIMTGTTVLSKTC